jgi:hypothetical protein
VTVAAVQNNWITGVGGKLQRFRRHGLWFLDSEKDLKVLACTNIRDSRHLYISYRSRYWPCACESMQ